MRAVMSASPELICQSHGHQVIGLLFATASTTHAAMSSAPARQQPRSSGYQESTQESHNLWNLESLFGRVEFEVDTPSDIRSSLGSGFAVSFSASGSRAWLILAAAMEAMVYRDLSSTQRRLSEVLNKRESSGMREEHLKATYTCGVLRT